MIDSTPAISDAEGGSDLERDEDEPMEIDESDDSGSEFELDSDVEDEEIMIDVAIRSSLQTFAERIAGPSSNVASSTASMSHAAAAERRLARMNKQIEFEFETPEDSLGDQCMSSEEEPLASSKDNSKVASRPTKKAIPLSDDSKKFMTMSEHRAAQKEARTAFLSARRANKREERALIAKLDRKLTHASSLPQIISNPNL